MGVPGPLPQLNVSPLLAAPAWGLENALSLCYTAAGTRMAVKLLLQDTCVSML